MMNLRPTITVRQASAPNYTIVCADGLFGRNEQVIPMHIDDFKKAWQRYVDGEYIQVSFSNLTVGMREFLLTGMPLSRQEEVFDEDDT